MSAVREEKVTKFAEKHPGENFYMLRTDQIPFGFLYVGARVCTLGWQGTLIFSRLDEEVLTELPSLITNTRIEHLPTDKVSVSLVKQVRELVEYDLAVKPQYEEYSHDINRPDMISFARYDAELYRPQQLLRPILYAFTAENPQWSSGESEITVLLPRFEPWPERLLDWVIRHHVDSGILQSTLDLSAFSAKIAALAGSNQASINN
jgi:hypothetical protein